MKFAPWICALCVLAGSVRAQTTADTSQKAAESAAMAWLTLVDGGQYQQSWESASAVFRQKISWSQWQSRIAAVRGPLGALRSRALQSATPRNALPGAPDGRYVVLKFATSFEHKADAIETVTPVFDADGHWHVSGYFIR
jgi:Protein of unknown function (DUF4019)